MNYIDKYCKFDGEYNIHEYYHYVEDVLNHRIVTSKAIYLACKRFERWLSRTDIYFDEKDVDQRINLIYLMKHTKGKCAGQHFKLLPWQQFCLAGIFGFKDSETKLRVVHDAFIYCARKSGKTALAAAFMLSGIICDREQGAECDFIANNTKQASIGLTQCIDFAKSIDPNGKVFKQYRSEIKMPSTKSVINVMSGDSMGQDGFSPSLACIDEIHAAKDWQTYEIVKSGQGYRENPLIFTITTSGFLVGSDFPCYSLWQTGKEVLKKDNNDGRFIAIFELDEGDDWKDPANWIKANPSLGQTVKENYLEDRVKTAEENISQRPLILTKNFNIFSKDITAWIKQKDLENSSAEFELSDLQDEDNSLYSYVGIDLSAVSDLTCVTTLVKKEAFYYFKTYFFLPEESLDNNPNSELYRAWHNSGYLITTPGNVTDYDYILEHMKGIQDEVPILKVAYDSWNSTQFSISATEQGFPMYPFSQTLGNFNRPTKEFERLILSKKVVIDDNPITRWCFANCQLKTDNNGNSKPIKGGTKMEKIDATITILEALGAYLSDNYEEPTCEYITNS